MLDIFREKQIEKNKQQLITNVFKYLNRYL
jgi:hypothetical protein